MIKKLISAISIFLISVLVISIGTWFLITIICLLLPIYNFIDYILFDKYIDRIKIDFKKINSE